MEVFPNGKINLGLRILRKRSDGFHDLETIFYPIACNDVLEIIRSENDTQFVMTGLGIEGDPQANLCLKAYELLKRDFPQVSNVRIHLHKVLPMGAGLGGGSSDASFTLHLLNRIFQLGLDNASLMRYALTLGSDCPFFLLNQPCHATGRGEILEPVQLGLDEYSIALVNPGIHVSTAEAFSLLTPALPPTSLKDIIRQPVNQWKDQLQNDFEPVVFAMHPEVKNIRQQLYEAGAVYAAMSGSGSTVFGLFRKDQPPTLSFPGHYMVKLLNGKF